MDNTTSKNGMAVEQAQLLTGLLILTFSLAQGKRIGWVFGWMAVTLESMLMEF
jgi:hypothetical protein